ncbi:MAG: hypothetical protein O9297_06460 [Flavobacterium sp.]|jgi:hypothetical protein|uniref:hypothetical protein n=1 Tax=Flavobacterium sp. TaxID=239 RepID=UPI0022C3CE3D|nr:hypothetical protein [Flavobacterium sp.]MCZ8169463.1 hypothetical protein [Flavobacterium sp.]MCZ8296844.1 hypothetical protein [Flavobacterium sp.]
MTYKDFEINQNFIVKAQDFLEKMDPVHYTPFPEMNVHLYNMFSQNREKIKKTYFHELIKDLKAGDYKSLNRYVLFIVLDPFEENDAKYFLEIFKSISTAMDTFGCTNELLEFLWWQLDFTANEGLYMNQLEQFQSVFTALQKQVSEHDPLDDYQIRKKIYEILVY